MGNFHPGRAPPHADILGALDVAMQEFSRIPNGANRRVVVVTDFLEDDAQYRFASDPALAMPATAKILSTRIRAARGFNIPQASICLGRLGSSDYASLSPRRKEAIATFWQVYLTQNGRAPEITFDGPGLLGEAHGRCLGTPIDGGMHEVGR